MLLRNSDAPSRGLTGGSLGESDNSHQQATNTSILPASGAFFEVPINISRCETYRGGVLTEAGTRDAAKRLDDAASIPEALGVRLTVGNVLPYTIEWFVWQIAAKLRVVDAANADVARAWWLVVNAPKGGPRNGR